MVDYACINVGLSLGVPALLGLILYKYKDTLDTPQTRYALGFLYQA
jgi:hypothetical protein